MTFPEAITDRMPSDNDLVIGTIASGNPLIVTAAGGPVEGVGRLSQAGFNVGDPVALIRQEGTWLALGKMVGATQTGFGLTDLQMSTSNAVLGLTAVEQDVPNTTINFTTTAPAAKIVAVWFGDYDVILA